MMSQSKLRQVLSIFENATAPLSLPQIAKELEVSRDSLDSMIQHWVRKGKIREGAASLSDCETCSSNNGSCAYVVDLPRTYELVREDDGLIQLNQMNVASGCKHAT
jgi:hypothetical protein